MRAAARNQFMSVLNDRIERTTELLFPINIADGSTVMTVGDAADLLATLSSDQRTKNHWEVAIRMLDIALREPAYLKAATMSLQTAVAMDGRLDQAFRQ